jgi:hypothetical protein
MFGYIGMKRLLLSLWVIGGVLYLVSTLLFTNAVNMFGNDDPKPPATEGISPSLSPHPSVALAEQTEPSQPSGQLEAVSPAAADTPHAILPEQAASEAPAAENPPSLVQGEQSPSNGEATQSPSGPGPNEAERVKVVSEASVRSGPSTSATVIGTAHAGAEARVVSRKGGWVHIIDPASSRMGWIYSKFIASVTTNEAVSTRTPAAKTQQAAKQGSKANRSARRQVAPGALPSAKQIGKRWPPPEFAELPTDDEFLQPRKRGRFGIFVKRRMMREGLLEPEEKFQPSRYGRW